MIRYIAFFIILILCCRCQEKGVNFNTTSNLICVNSRLIVNNIRGEILECEDDLNGFKLISRYSNEIYKFFSFNDILYSISRIDDFNGEIVKYNNNGNVDWKSKSFRLCPEDMFFLEQKNNIIEYNCLQKVEINDVTGEFESLVERDVMKIPMENFEKGLPLYAIKEKESFIYKGVSFSTDELRKDSIAISFYNNFSASCCNDKIIMFKERQNESDYGCSIYDLKLKLIKQLKVDCYGWKTLKKSDKLVCYNSRKGIVVFNCGKDVSVQEINNEKDEYFLDVDILDDYLYVLNQYGVKRFKLFVN